MVADIEQINNADTTRLQDDLHLGFWGTMAARLRKFHGGEDGSESRFPQKVADELAPWLAAEADEQRIYKKDRKSGFTKLIKEKDSERDALLREVKKTVNTFATLSIFPESQAAALAIQPVMQKFKVAPTQGYAAESVAVDSWLVVVLRDERLVQAARTLGILESIRTLKALNDEFDQLIVDRNNERSKQTVAELREARRLSDLRWRYLVTALNAAAIMDEDEQRYTALFRGINEVIKYYKRLAAQRRRQNARDKDKPEDL